MKPVALGGQAASVLWVEGGRCSAVPATTPSSEANGDDTINGGAGFDTAYGGGGADTCIAESAIGC